MKSTYLLTLLLALTFVSTPAIAQDSFFEFSTTEEGFEAAKARDKMVLVYFYDEQAPDAATHDHLWRDPLIARFVDKLTVPVSISKDSEAGQAFMNSKKKRKRKADPLTPGIYFLSDSGRTLGILKGTLAGQEGIGQMMLMLGAADYARHENKREYGNRRFMRGR